MAYSLYADAHAGLFNPAFNQQVRQALMGHHDVPMAHNGFAKAEHTG